jgi:ABC-2 type transport system ATP-binding protein
MKRRLAMARSLLHDPELVFLDEPLSGLDPAGARDIRTVIQRMAEEGKTIFLTTHNLSEAERLCSRIGVIHRGRLIVSGTAAEIRGQMSRPSVRIGAEGVDAEVMDGIRAIPFVEAVWIEDGELVVELDHPRRTGRLVRLLVESGAEVWKVAPQERSLEEVFLELVADEENV